MELPNSTKVISPAAGITITSLSPMPIQKLQRGPPPSNEVKIELGTVQLIAIFNNSTRIEPILMILLLN
jgi:hypothetical protein